jgi:hypothetical protein
MQKETTEQFRDFHSQCHWEVFPQQDNGIMAGKKCQGEKENI